MAWIDWGLIIISLVFMISVVYLSKSYMRSVADFLSGGRTAGRYIISVSAGMAGVGAISIVGLFEINYIAGWLGDLSISSDASVDTGSIFRNAI